MMDSVDISLISYLAAELQHREDEVDHEFTNSARTCQVIFVKLFSAKKLELDK